MCISLWNVCILWSAELWEKQLGDIVNKFAFSQVYHLVTLLNMILVHWHCKTQHRMSSIGVSICLVVYAISKLGSVYFYQFQFSSNP